MSQKICLAAFLLISIFTGNRSSAQGFSFNSTGATADASAIVDVMSTSQGMLVPRMTQAQRNAIVSPATGLLIYQTNGTPGFYYYNGGWQPAGDGAPSGAAGGVLTGTYPNPTLNTTGVSAGTYGSTSTVAQIAVNSKGRITNAADLAIAPAGAAGGDLTGTYPNPTLATTGVTAGTYGSASTSPQITVDAKGRVTGVTVQTINPLPSGTNGKVLQLVSGSAAWAGNVLAIGTSFGGGKVAYILQPGDPGYDPIVQHGLIAAASDQSASIQWYNGSFANMGIVGAGFGTGKWNTIMIMARQGTGNFAASLCNSYTGGGLSDWHLPSKDELHQLYVNRAILGGFTGSVYWSSTEAVANLIWVEDFAGSSGQYNLTRSATVAVRAVRAF